MTEIKNAVVVGAGTMGHGIAHALITAGIQTTLVDVNATQLDHGVARIRAILDGGVSRGKLSSADRDAAWARLHHDTTYGAVGAADLVVEVIVERMEVKCSLFAALAEDASATCILASNTSSLSITEIASAATHPDRVIGLHFFNPVHAMKLLEIVRGAATSTTTVDAALALAQRLGKTPIVVDDAPGFATSRLGICLGNEAMRMVEERVAQPTDIDTAMKLGYGHPMGPLALSDLVGLDVRLAITEALHRELGTDGFRAPRILRTLVRAGHLGQKTGNGFYRWENGSIVGLNPFFRRELPRSAQ